MKKTKIIATTLAVLLSIATLIGTNVKGFSATPISDTNNNTITINRNVKNVSNPVTNTFTYTIEEVSKPTGATVSGMPTSATVVFNAEVPNSSTHIATQTGTIDLSSVTFNELGDYKYKITETASSNETDFPLDNSEYYFYVTVRNEVNNTTNNPTGNLVVTLVPNAIKGEGTNKEEVVYESEVKTTNLTISKEVTGDGARLDEYFEITLNIGGNTGDQYLIKGSHSTDGRTATNESTYTVGTTTRIYLKHGDEVTVGKNGETNQILVGTNYTVTEAGATDYVTTINGTAGKTTGTKTAEEDASKNISAIVNNKELDPVTGVFVNIMPFVVLVMLAVIGIYAIKKTSSKED